MNLNRRWNMKEIKITSYNDLCSIRVGDIYFKINEFKSAAATTIRCYVCKNGMDEIKTFVDFCNETYSAIRKGHKDFKEVTGYDLTFSNFIFDDKNECIYHTCSKGASVS